MKTTRKKQKPRDNRGFVHGAVNQIRTGDLFLGKEALYQLSYYRERSNPNKTAADCQRVNAWIDGAGVNR